LGRNQARILIQAQLAARHPSGFAQNAGGLQGFEIMGGGQCFHIGPMLNPAPKDRVKGFSIALDKKIA
jgi:hypothetical protein